MSIWSLALLLFLVANPVGNTPAFVSLVKYFDFHRQKQILFREAVFSFLIAFTFLFIGKPFLKILDIHSYALSICGGILLIIVAIDMIFPPESQLVGQGTHKEPYIVPIATPLITGGGVLSTIMIYAEKESLFTMMGAIIIAWIAVTCVVVSAAYLQKILGKRGLLAMEQIMGMMLALLSSQLIVNGVTSFIAVLQKG